MGEEMAYGGRLFPDTGCPVPDVNLYHVSYMINVWESVITFIHPRWMFLPTEIL